MNTVNIRGYTATALLYTVQMVFYSYGNVLFVTNTAHEYGIMRLTSLTEMAAIVKERHTKWHEAYYFGNGRGEIVCLYAFYAVFFCIERLYFVVFLSISVYV